MTPTQRVGQLFMAGCPSVGDCAGLMASVRSGDIGSVILTGRSYAGAAPITATTTALQAAAQAGGAPRLFIAADQEGGEVQALQGPGFDRIPSQLNQGGTGAVAAKANALRWAQQLKAVGVNLDLAPVVDTVPSAGFASQNPPIGQLDRQFGYDPAQVASLGTAVVSGMLAGGVDTTIKHFPGLGRVTENTDTNAGVTDDVTTASDPFLQPFQAGIRAGSPFVMMSTAVYSKIDRNHPAAFSSQIVTTLLRQTLGFNGVVISDDLGAAVQVSSWSLAERATMFVAAGGDMVLTVDGGQIPAMKAGVLARMATDAAFAASVKASVLRILAAKSAQGLL